MTISVNENLSHFKTSKIKASNERSYSFFYKGGHYEIDFSDSRVGANAGYCIRNLGNEHNDPLMLQWLTLYFGESADDWYATKNNTLWFTRGEQEFNLDGFLRFIKKVEKHPLKSYPKWRNELIRRSLSYFALGTKLSVSYMPISVGFFALSIEALSNAYIGNREKYHTLGEKRYRILFDKKLEIFKKNPTHKATVKSFAKHIDRNVDLIIAIRNSYYGHSLMHQSKNLNVIRSALKNWEEFHGWRLKKNAEWSHGSAGVEHFLQLHGMSIFKISMNVNRLLLFYLLNMRSNLPFTEHDFTLPHAPCDLINIEHPPRIA